MMQEDNFVAEVLSQLQNVGGKDDNRILLSLPNQLLELCGQLQGQRKSVAHLRAGQVAGQSKTGATGPCSAYRGKSP